MLNKSFSPSLIRSYAHSGQSGRRADTGGHRRGGVGLPVKEVSPRNVRLPGFDSVGNLGIRLTAVTPVVSLAWTCEPGEIPEECEMSIRPRLGVEVPALTARVVRASNPGRDDGDVGPGPARLHMGRRRLHCLWEDEDFAGWYSRDGRPESRLPSWPR
jgi:hypothetical protein